MFHEMTMKIIIYVALSLLALSADAISSSKSINDPGTLSSTSTPLSIESELVGTQALKWGISEEDLLRYEDLMDGPRGIQSPGLDPLSTLGIEARTQEKRQQYADKWVKTEFERTEKELRFQREISAAWKRLYSNVQPVRIGKDTTQQSSSTTRVALFVKGQNCRQCDSRVTLLMSGKRPVDIYLVDSHGNDSVLREWAQKHEIPVKRMRDRHVTLNHDRGLWQRYGKGIMPVALQHGGSGWEITAF
jgi:integrating conjugative element protein (TIGR03759 family)